MQHGRTLGPVAAVLLSAAVLVALGNEEFAESNAVREASGSLSEASRSLLASLCRGALILCGSLVLWAMRLLWQLLVTFADIIGLPAYLEALRVVASDGIATLRELPQLLYLRARDWASAHALELAAVFVGVLGWLALREWLRSRRRRMLGRRYISTHGFVAIRLKVPASAVQLAPAISAHLTAAGASVGHSSGSSRSRTPPASSPGARGASSTVSASRPRGGQNAGFSRQLCCKMHCTG